MPRSSNQKQKLLIIMQTFLEETDEKHYITVNELKEILYSAGISCERKSIYDDIETLKSFGMDILTIRSNKVYGYYLASRTFELAELKMLSDIIEASKFITPKKSRELVDKLGTLCSKYEKTGIVNNVDFAAAPKNINERIFYNVDEIDSAIRDDCKIRFKYIDYFYKGKTFYRKNGEDYFVSPYALIWDDENYYLAAYDDASNMLKHFRVDKLEGIVKTDDKRSGKEKYLNMDTALYAKKMFGMFPGKEQTVTFLITKRLIKVFIDRFGSDIILHKADETHMRISVKLDESQQFYGWLSGIGSEAKIVSPQSVADGFKAYLNDIINNY